MDSNKYERKKPYDINKQKPLEILAGVGTTLRNAHLEKQRGIQKEKGTFFEPYEDEIIKDTYSNSTTKGKAKEAAEKLNRTVNAVASRWRDLAGYRRKEKRGGKKSLKKNKITKKVKKRGGGNTPSAMSESGIEMTEMKCHNEKRKIRSQIQEVKAALEPQFKMAEKVNVDQIGKNYNEQDVKDYKTYKGMELDPGMSNRLTELYNKLQELQDKCPDVKKGGKKSRKTKKRKSMKKRKRKTRRKTNKGKK